MMTFLAVMGVITNIAWLIAYFQLREDRDFWANEHARAERVYGPFTYYNPDGLGRG